MMQLGLIGKNESIQKFLCDSGGDQTDAYCYKRSSNQSALNESMGIYYEIYELFKFMLLHQLLYHPRETHTLYPHSSVLSSCITLYIYRYNLCITIITRIKHTNSVRNDEICLITITIILMNQAQIKIGLQSNRIKCAHGPLNNFNFLLYHLSVLPLSLRCLKVALRFSFQALTTHNIKVFLYVECLCFYRGVANMKNINCLNKL